MIRVGIVGAGIRGRIFANAVRARRDAQLVGVADPVEACLNWLPAGLRYETSRRLIDECQPDAIVIASPDFAHFDSALEAANAGMAILIEKPMTTCTREADILVEVSRKSQIMVGFENRWNPLVAAAHDQIAGTGEVLWQTIELSNTTRIPTEMISWAHRSSPGWFLMPHSVDLAAWVDGSRPMSVFASGGRGRLAKLGVSTWDWLQADIIFESGSSAQLTSSWVLPEGAPHEVEFRYAANASNLSVRADFIEGTGIVASRTEANPLVPLRLQSALEGMSPPEAMLNDFLDRLLAGQELSPDAYEGAVTTYVIQAIMRSAETGVRQVVGRP